MTEGDLPLLGIWAFQLFDIFLYGAIGWYLDHVMTSASGNKMPWNFLWSKQYWSKTAPLSNGTSDSYSHAAIRVLNLSKEFPSKPYPVKALADLSFEMLDGEVTALLGQNGAGKSTAISALTGLVTPDTGHALVYGLRLPEEMQRIQGMTGVCPQVRAGQWLLCSRHIHFFLCRHMFWLQHDLLFDDLTVGEHLDLFGAIKGVSPQAARDQGMRWLKLLGIDNKIDDRSKTLSGGQKRKLSVTMALLGDPKFVLLDEPTAGMDPHSRRAVWDLVQSSKAGRSLLLTTHFMDEADALADHIVVISDGSRCAGGTPSELKAKYGAGYHLRAAMKPDTPAAPLTAFVQQHVPGAVLEEDQALQASLLLPNECLADFGNLFEALDASMESLGVTGYGISLPSMQEVFLLILDKEAKGGYVATGSKLETDSRLEIEASSPAHQPPPPSLGYQLRTMLVARGWMIVSERKTMAFSWGLCLALVLASFLIPALIDSDSTDPFAIPESVELSPSVFTTSAPPLPYMPSNGAVQSRLAEGSALQRRYGYRPKKLDSSNCSSPSWADCHHALSSVINPEAALGAFALPGVI